MHGQPLPNTPAGHMAAAEAGGSTTSDASDTGAGREGGPRGRGAALLRATGDCFATGGEAAGLGEERPPPAGPSGSGPRAVSSPLVDRWNGGVGQRTGRPPVAAHAPVAAGRCVWESARASVLALGLPRPPHSPLFPLPHGTSLPRSRSCSPAHNRFFVLFTPSHSLARSLARSLSSPCSLCPFPSGPARRGNMDRCLRVNAPSCISLVLAPHNRRPPTPHSLIRCIGFH